MSIFRHLAKSAGIAAVAVTGLLALASAASAATVNFSTSGTFMAGSSSAVASGSSISAGDFTLTFSPIVMGTVTPDSNAILGAFQVSRSGTGSMSSFDGASFTLTITQTAPGTAGSGSSTATLQGTIQSNTQSNLVVMSYSPNPVVIQSTDGGTVFTTSYNIRDTEIDPLSLGGGNADQRAFVSQTAVPSPTAGLGGLVLLGGSVLRRRRTAA